MFCPSCRDEFRTGFTRCARCEVDLVPELDAELLSATAADPPPEIPGRVAEYCGFFSLDDARHARDRLRERRITCDIVIREASDADRDSPLSEEFWLRVDTRRYREAHAVLGDGAEADGEERTTCSACGQSVASAESFCPGCGARFDEG